MNPSRLLPGLALLFLVGGCAVQDAASGYGDEDADIFKEDAPPSSDDAGVPAFDIPVDPPDEGVAVPDSGPVSVEPDVGMAPLDTGPVTQADVGFSRDLGIAPLDRGVFPTDRGIPTTLNCASQTSCASCTAQATCGWCGLTARCMDGSSTGPLGGATCALGWAWTSSACVSVDPCSASTSCGACAGQAGCGWCGASNRCVTANTARTGPASGVCLSAWSGSVAACTAAPPDPCAIYTDCGSCSAALSCGWCRSGTGRCMTGTSTGPNPTYGTCTSWAYTRSQCSNPSDPCNSSTGCGRCTDRSGCGWCEDSNTCHSGTSSGPSDRACRSSNWTWDNFFGICSPF